MSIFGKIAAVVTDPGAVVKDTVNSLLPKEGAIVGDLAGALTDLAEKKNPLAIKHLLEALHDLPQAACGIAQALPGASKGWSPSVSGHSEGWRGSPATEPPPPPRGPQVNISVNSSGQITINIKGTAPFHVWQNPATPTTGTPCPPPLGFGWFGPALPASPAPSTGPGSGCPTGASNGTPGYNHTGAINSKDQINGMSDTDFMNAVRDGRISQDVSKDPAAMLAIQDRMSRIAQMNQMMSQMMAAMHDMAKSTIQNIRA